MQLSITQKLVISFVGLTVIVLAGTLLLARWSFAQGFLDYVNALEQGRLQQVAEDLAEMYQFRNQDWPQVLDSNLVRQIERSAGQPGGSLRQHSARPPGRPDQPGMSKPPPRRHLDKPPGANTKQRPQTPGQPPPGQPPGAVPTDNPFHPPNASAGLPPHQALPVPGRQHRGPGPRRRAMLPTSLYDAAGSHLAGPLLSTSASGQIVVPITVGDEVVGELRTQPRRELNSTQETEFSQQQLNASILIALVALLISVLLSVFLARALLAPVHRLMTAVNSMASGNYELSLGPPREDELGALMRNVQRLSQALLESQAARKRWLADISHELRTPVTILTGELEALQLGMRNLDEQQLDSFSEEVNRINKLVDDLYQLALSDMGALRYQFAEVDVFQCMQQVVQTLTQQQSTSSTPGLPIHLTGNSGAIYAGRQQALPAIYEFAT